MTVCLYAEFERFPVQSMSPVHESSLQNTLGQKFLRDKIFKVFVDFCLSLKNKYLWKQPVAFSHMFSKMALLKYFKPTKVQWHQHFPFQAAPF